MMILVDGEMQNDVPLANIESYDIIKKKEEICK
jgi:hypothetical protein